MYTQLNEATMSAPRPRRHHVEGWPPPKRRHPPPRRRIRAHLATALTRLARRIDDRAAWRTFAS